MAAAAEVVYMGEPPDGQGRWDAKSRLPMMRIVGALTMSLATISFSLRVFTRVKLIKKPLNMGDYMAGASTIFCWAFYAITLCMAKYGGAGRHMWQTTMEEYTEMLKWTLGLAASYILAAESAKISILLFYHQLSPNQKFHLTVTALIALLGCYAVVYIAMNIFGCRPISDAWNVTGQVNGTTHCIDKGNFYLAAVVVNVAIDFIIIILPIPVIAPLQMPLKRKISLCLLFATGGFTIAAAIVNSVLTIKLFESDDYNWDITMELFWMYSELASCVICASASSLKPLFSIYVLPRLNLGSSNVSTGRTGFSGQLSRRADRKGYGTHHTAIELESDDDRTIGNSERAPGVDADDQTQLWSRVANHGLNEPPQTVNISSRDSDDKSSEWNSETHHRAQDGINVVQRIDVDYGSSTFRAIN